MNLEILTANDIPAALAHSNLSHPTVPLSPHWMLGVECWMLGVLPSSHGMLDVPPSSHGVLDVLLAPSTLAAIFEDAEWKIGVGFMIGLIVFAAAMGAWRSLTGTDRTKADVRIESDFVTHSELDSRLQGLASEIERKFEKALHEEFKQLNGERSRSVAGLHEKVEETTGQLRRELSDRINVVDGLVRQIQGELKHFFRSHPHHE